MNRIRKWTPALCLMLCAILIMSYSTFAWFKQGDGFGSSRFSIVKLNSKVTLYQAVDTNYNGVADLCDSAAEYTTTYYTEKHKFEQIGDVNYATTTKPTTNLDMLITLNDMIPGRICTYKFALVNLGETDTVIDTVMEKIVRGDLTDKEWGFLSTLSMRVVSIREGENEDPVYIFSDKVFLCDNMNTDAEIPICINETIGDIFASENFGNCYDFLLLFEMEPFDELLQHGGFTISEQSVYNSLADGTEIALPLITMIFTISYQEA